MKNIQQVTVFCASSDKINSKYFKSTEQIARILVEHNITVMYGGGAVGLMGRLADSVIERNGTIIGCMPEFMHKVEWQHNGINDLIIVPDMHARKRKFLESTDALIALPGGCGTLEELMEAITLKRLGVFVKPIIIFNQDGFYNPLIEMLNRCIEEKFMRKKHGEIWTVIEKPEEIIEAIKKAPEWDHSAIEFAAV